LTAGINTRFYKEKNSIFINLQELSESYSNLKTRESEKLIFSGVFLIGEKIHVGHWNCRPGVCLSINEKFRGLNGVKNKLRNYWKGFKSVIFLQN